MPEKQLNMSVEGVARIPKLPHDPIEEMAGALTDPIIVFPAGGWEQDIPESLKGELPLRRLVHVKLCLDGKAAWEEACDLEALIYLYPASLAAPMPHEWARIYLYLGTKCLGETFPEDLRQETLSDYEMGILRDLKRWLQKKKREARKDKGRKEAKDTPTRAEEYGQLKMQV